MAHSALCPGPRPSDSHSRSALSGVTRPTTTPRRRARSRRRGGPRSSSASPRGHGAAGSRSRRSRPRESEDRRRNPRLHRRSRLPHVADAGGRRFAGVRPFRASGDARRATFVRDRLIVHRAPQVNKVLARVPRASVTLQPAHAAELNPVEAIWCNGEASELRAIAATERRMSRPAWTVRFGDRGGIITSSRVTSAKPAHATGLTKSRTIAAIGSSLLCLFTFPTDWLCAPSVALCVLCVERTTVSAQPATPRARLERATCRPAKPLVAPDASNAPGAT
jgi:hypothetical protein